MGHEKSDQEILNVFREKHPETVTTEELAEALAVHRRTAQKYVKNLQVNGYLTIASEGKPNHWKLSESEPKEPIYREELARAIRIGNKSEKVGLVCLYVSFGALAAVGLVTSNHIFAEAFNLYLPFFDASQAAAAAWIGVAGSLIFGISAIAIIFGRLLPKIVEWQLDAVALEEA